MRRFILSPLLPCLVFLTLWGCEGDTVTFPGDPPEGSEFVKFEVHRNSLEITDAVITWPSGLIVEKALLAVGRDGRGLLYPGDNYSTPVFLDTRADILSVHYESDNYIEFCGAQDGGMGTMRVVRIDTVNTISNSAVGNLTGVSNGYVCSDAGEILSLNGDVLEPVFQAPEGVSFNNIYRYRGIIEYAVAVGDDGAIFHSYEDGDFLDESIEDGPDFVSIGAIYSSTSSTLYAVGGDEIWKFSYGSWTKDYDFAAGNLNDIAIVEENIIVVGDNGLILKKEIDGTGWWDDCVDVDVDLTAITKSPTFNVDGIIRLCGSRGEIFKATSGGWEDLNHHAQGPWAAMHCLDDGSVYATNGNRVMRFESGDWAEFSVWEMGYQLHDIHVIDPTHIWAIGVMEDGVDHFVLFYDGDWTIRKQASLDGFNAIWCNAAGDDVFVTDDAGTVWRYHDDIWEIDYTHTELLALNDLSGAGIDDLVGVGDSGLILRRGAEGWAIETSGTEADLIAADGPFIVGAEGTILEDTGGSWVQAEVTWDDSFNAVWYGGGDDVWAVGDDATVFHFDGTTWTRLLTHLPGIDFLSVDSAGINRVWIGGTEGYLLRSPE